MRAIDLRARELNGQIHLGIFKLELIRHGQRATLAGIYILAHPTRCTPMQPIVAKPTLLPTVPPLPLAWFTSSTGSIYLFPLTRLLALPGAPSLSPPYSTNCVKIP